MTLARRKHIKAVRVILQLATLAAIGFWGWQHISIRGKPAPEVREQWFNRSGFFVLSFGGISFSASDDGLSRNSFREFLQALSAAGYNAVHASDIVEYYQKGAPLPDKAVLLIFEGGRKDSAIFGQGALSETGMRANICFPPRIATASGDDLLTKQSANALARNAVWEVIPGESSHPLSFTGEGRAFNNRAGDMRRLTRLNVDARLSPEFLVRLLEPWPAGETWQGLSETDPGHIWYVEAGNLETRSSEVILHGGGDDGQTALAWFAGSHQWRNVEVRGTLSGALGGERSLYLRLESSNSFIRIRMANDALLIQESTPAGLATIHTHPVSPGHPVPFHLVLINGILRFAFGDNLSSMTALPVLPEITEGYLAIEARGMTGPRPMFDDVEIAPLPERWLATEGSEGTRVTGVMIPLAPGVPSDEIMRKLLRAAGAGRETYAVLPAGRHDLALLERVEERLPAPLRSKAWSGVVFTPEPSGNGGPCADLLAAARAARERGLRPVFNLMAWPAASLTDATAWSAVRPLEAAALLPANSSLDTAAVREKRNIFDLLLFETADSWTCTE